MPREVLGQDNLRVARRDAYNTALLAENGHLNAMNEAIERQKKWKNKVVQVLEKTMGNFADLLNSGAIHAYAALRAAGGVMWRKGIHGGYILVSDTLSSWKERVSSADVAVTDLFYW